MQWPLFWIRKRLRSPDCDIWRWRHNRALRNFRRCSAIYRCHYECKCVNPNTEWNDDCQRQDTRQERNFPVIVSIKSKNWYRANMAPVEYVVKNKAGHTKYLQKQEFKLSNEGCSDFCSNWFFNMNLSL